MKRFLPLLLVFFLYGFSQSSLSDIETAILKNEYSQAQELAQKLIDESTSPSEKQEALYYVGLSQLHLEHYSESRQTFFDLLAQSPSIKLADKSELGIIDSFLLGGQYEAAIIAAEKFIKTRPKSEFLSLAYLKLARANLKLTRWQKAKGYLQKIITQFPDSMESHLASQLLNEKQYFAVQLGSFIDSGRAEILTEELKGKGEYAYIVETTDHSGKKFYRVRVGQLSSLEEAESLEQKLTKLGYPTRIYP